ncbi:HugZ family protein [Rhodovulum sp. MB263]|uniref:HugZ family pyridoxamine 5'-phosphate oxidase n=1 Tax=Rhodovulum sp. (strain MB263) TaxID=308754 RepID=UPI0009B75034|nr:pyridoxamine 5'-phosphate oxidase family protein [Rhodovulum sp. MB263]ARC88174.1 pyridoxamine 5-phosphate oxidase [Rhodovulum sp. MB263]
MATSDPFRPVDATALALARKLIAGARFAALAVLRDGAPFVTRIALTQGPDGLPVTLVSDLAPHTTALRACPDCSLLLGEPGPKGNPLTHPRLTLQARAVFVTCPADRAALRETYLRQQPKARLYVDFTDFHFVRLMPQSGHLNGGFGQAFRLDAADLTG